MFIKNLLKIQIKKILNRFIKDFAKDNKTRNNKK